MASLQEKYSAFLARPTTGCLAPKASLHYVPTLVSLNDPIAILKHLDVQQQCVAKQNEKFLNVIESADSLCIETETTLKFLIGGATYLPGLDDNFISDKVVTAAILHIVSFDSDQKITQIRLHWDQASLLKDVETIGARGRNWPIHSGKDQARLVATSAAAAPHDLNASAATGEEERIGRTKSRGVDPHSTLALFSPREVTSSSRDESTRNLVAPRDSAKPAPREWGELFANGEEPAVEPERSLSPSKLDNPIKAGAGKHYNDIRLFSPEKEELVTEKGIKTDAKKYNHFEFGEAEFQPSPIKNNRTKHMSQWDFADFVTPEKHRERKTAYPRRNFDLNDTYGDSEAAAIKPPVFTQHVPHPRPDASAHFDFGEAIPAEEKAEKPIIARTAKAMGLYEDHILGSEKEDTVPVAAGSGEPEKQPLSNITNTNTNANPKNSHHTNFESSWDAKDQYSPAPVRNENDVNQTVADEKQKSVRNLGAGWNIYDETPEQPAQGIKILGNGSGSSRMADKGWWDY